MKTTLKVYETTEDTLLYIENSSNGVIYTVNEKYNDYLGRPIDRDNNEPVYSPDYQLEVGDCDTNKVTQNDILQVFKEQMPLSEMKRMIDTYGTKFKNKVYKDIESGKLSLRWEKTITIDYDEEEIEEYVLDTVDGNISEFVGWYENIADSFEDWEEVFNYWPKLEKLETGKESIKHTRDYLNGEQSWGDGEEEPECLHAFAVAFDEVLEYSIGNYRLFFDRNTYTMYTIVNKTYTLDKVDIEELMLKNKDKFLNK